MMQAICEVNGGLQQIDWHQTSNTGIGISNISAGGAVSSAVSSSGCGGTLTGGSLVGNLNVTSAWWPYYNYWPTPTIYWNSYPVYVTSDKTAKAIEILKALQDEKLIEVKSVPKFIALVEKIKGLL